ncbi:LysR family transcriptional regulator [Ramlibacter sp.]|uniref:LysR family transcriptional regulator n=1 Tax=Ramlibacter sp. TaxID=1917967 RepID=UPI002CFF24D4|nr:LysR family transcriptional regulator [Ramlibacter sp.]HWI80506.1 LysR family transcriptional regulator [Ramlibacter sp.]
MNIEFLHSFVTVADVGSMAEAARRLDLTPAAIAARLHALEDELGTALIQRAGRSVRLTEAGLKILERARGMLRDMRDLRAIAHDSSLPGELRLGVFSSALTSVLPPVLRHLYDAHPELSVFVSPGSSVDLCHRVSAGELDAAIVVEPQFVVPKNCEWQALTEEPLVVVAHASQAGGEPHALLAGEPFIRYDRMSVGGQLADRYLRDHDIRPRQRLEIDSLAAIAALVDQGLGVALLPDWPPLWTGGMNLVRIPLPGRAPVRRIGIVLALQGPCVPLARSLLRAAQAVLRRAPPVAARAPKAPTPKRKSAARRSMR